MKATFLAVLWLGFVLGTSALSSDSDGAVAAVSGSLTGESTTSAETNSGLISAFVGGTSPADPNNSYGLFALCSYTTLRVFVSAKTAATFGAAPYAIASASWTDTLRIDNPEIYTALSGAYAFFVPVADGRGKNGSATFNASIFHKFDEDHYDFQVADTKSVDFESSNFHARMPIILQVSLDQLLPGFQFNMGLEVRASASAFDSTMLDALVDFSHTAYLPPIFIGDIHGNPIPALAGLQIVGSSGLSYPVTVTAPAPEVPELNIAQEGGAMHLTWIDSAVGWQLQTSSDLVTWSDNGPVITGPGTLDDPISSRPRQYYRLSMPTTPVPLAAIAPSSMTSMASSAMVPNPSGAAVPSPGPIASSSPVAHPRKPVLWPRIGPRFLKLKAP